MLNILIHNVDMLEFDELQLYAVNVNGAGEKTPLLLTKTSSNPGHFVISNCDTETNIIIRIVNDDNFFDYEFTLPMDQNLSNESNYYFDSLVPQNTYTDILNSDNQLLLQLMIVNKDNRLILENIN